MSQGQSIQDFVNGMADANRAMWSQWFGGGKPLDMNEVGRQVSRNYQSNIDSSEKVVKDLLNIQVEWLRLLRNSMKTAKGTPKPVVDLVENTTQFAEGMVDARRQIWDGVFANARRLDFSNVEPLSVPGAVGDSASALTMWGALTQKAWELQQQMVTQFMPPMASQKSSEAVGQAGSKDAASAEQRSAGEGAVKKTLTARSA